jgi:L-alanine-DL-glutamate epimerase-like enolase superfamily enzyme
MWTLASWPRSFKTMLKAASNRAFRLLLLHNETRRRCAMKIKSIEIFGISLPLVHPFIIAYDTYYEIPSIIVRMETDDGFVGYGEAVPDEHVTGETYQSTIEVLKSHLAPVLLGENPFQIERIHEKMNAKIYGVPSAKAALDIACYDLMGKISGQPVYRLLGGPYHETVKVPVVLSIQEPERMAEEAKLAAEKGYSSIKIKIGHDVDMDIERVKAVRAAVGPAVQLRVDVNQGWKNVTTSLYALKRLEECGIDWIEQPILADDIDGLAEIRQKTTIPVMIDEGLHGSKELRQVIEKKAADLINIKLMKCGGLFPAVKLIYQAEMAGIRTQIGSMVESSVATAAGAHLALAKKNVLSNEMVGPFMFSRDIGNLKYDGERILLGSEPGLGIDVDQTILKSLQKVSFYIT